MYDILRGFTAVQSNDTTWRNLKTEMTALPASLSHVEMSFTFPRYPARLPYNIQRPFFLTDCLLGFFSVNVILLQTSLWKCHLATLFISSPALSSIVHHFPLDGSHTQGWSSSRAARTEVWLWEWRDGCSGCPDARVFFGLMFAQPWSPVIEDPLLLPTLHRCRGAERLSIMSIGRGKLQFRRLCLL